MKLSLELLKRELSFVLHKKFALVLFFYCSKNKHFNSFEILQKGASYHKILFLFKQDKISCELFAQFSSFKAISFTRHDNFFQIICLQLISCNNL